MVIPNGGVGTGTPLTPGVQAPLVQGPQSPLQYFMANGGNPALSQQYLSYLSALPPALAQQVAANPAQGFALWKQGVGTNPDSQGLTFQNGQYVNAQGQAYNRATDPADQADQAAQSQQWNTMIQNSPLYNNGGKANVNGAYANQGTVTPYGGLTPTTLTPGVTPTTPAQTGNGRLTGPGTPAAPAPAPTTNPPPAAPVTSTQDPNAVAKSNQLTATGAAQYTQPYQQTNTQPGNPGAPVSNSGASGGVNPYSGVGSALRANPYRLNTNNGWNL